MAHWTEFDYVVVNDEFEQAVADLLAIVHQQGDELAASRPDVARFAAGLPNLWIPAVDSFCEVPEIPVLGTGKLDLRGLKEMAIAKYSV